MTWTSVTICFLEFLEMGFCYGTYAKAINSAVFPGVQGGPLMHVIAAKAICLGEALKPEFKNYQTQTIANANALATALIENGHFVLSGGTDNHLVLIDLRPKFPNMTGKEAERALEKAHLTTNKNTVPGETRSPFKTSGIRLGTPAVTTRGMQEIEMRIIAKAIHRVLTNSEDENVISEVRNDVISLCDKFPLPY